MKKAKPFFALFKGEFFELPFFIFLTVILVGISAWSLADSPALRAPERWIPFVVLMTAHIVLYWLAPILTQTLPRILGYLLAQGSLVFAVNLIGSNLALIFGLYMGLIGITAGLLKLTRWGVGAIGLLLGLSLVNYGLNLGWANSIWWVAAVIPMTVFVIIYVILYNRQVEARERAQALLAELEAAHRQLAEYVDQVEDLTLANERQRMARELHDTLSQGLAGLILQLEASSAHLANQHPERAAEIIQQAMLQARATLADARGAIGNLRQAQPGPLDPVEAIRLETVRFTEATGIPCEFTANLSQPLAADRCEPVRRIVAEALTNVARHARASRCQVSLAMEQGQLELAVIDDGVGFDLATVGEQSGHFGLLGMRERARLVGGALEVLSQPGTGTKVRLRLPAAR